jgi:uncharacterized protein YndB with AHSA1/START domain
MKAYMMGAEVETDWRPGHPIVMSGEMAGKRFEDRGEVRSFDPGRGFSYTHQSGGRGPVHLVRFDVKGEGRETEVTITQANEDGSVSDVDRRRRAEYEQTWAKMLDGVEKAATGGEAGRPH